MHNFTRLKKYADTGNHHHMKINILHLLVLVGGLSLAGTASATPIPEDCQTGGIAIGCQSWTFNHYSVMEAIDKTAAAGGKGS